MGWGAITFLAHHFHSLAHRIHALVSICGWGLGGVRWGGVGCNNVLAPCAQIGRSLGIHFHLLAHCIHVLVSTAGWGLGGVGWGAITFRAHHFLYLLTASTSWSAWGGGGGVGCNNVLAQCARIGRSLGIHFHLLAHCIHVLVSMGGWGGVGWGAITYLRSAHGLDVHLVSSSTYLLTASMSWSAWKGGGGVGRGGVQ